MIDELQKSYEKQLTDLQLSESSIRMINHDLRNHLATIRELADCGTTQEINQYLNDYESKYTLSNEFITSNNSVLNAILNSKIRKCTDNKILFYITLTDTLTFMESSDMTALLSNLIDNAIEANIGNLSRKYIEFETINNDDIHIIRMENTFSNKPTIINDEFITTKKDSINHGIGTKIIREMVDKYNGELNYFITDETIEVIVTLN